MSAVPPRPLNFGEVLDVGFGFFRRDYRLYMPLAMVGLAPAMVATAIPTSADADPEALLADPGSGLLFLGLLAVGLLFSLLTWAALATAMDARMGNRRASIGSSYAQALAALPRLAVAALLAGAVLVLAVLVAAVPVASFTATGTSVSAISIILNVLLVVAVIAAVVGWWATHTFMLVPAVVVEGRGPFGGLRRSFGLVRGNRVRTLFVFTVMWLITVMPSLAAYSLAGSTSAIFAPNPAGAMGLVRYWAVQILSLGFQSVTTPLWIACAMVLFSDLRARSEGTDLRAAAQAMAG